MALATVDPFGGVVATARCAWRLENNNVKRISIFRQFRISTATIPKPIDQGVTMENSTKKFLVPIATALGALVSNSEAAQTITTNETTVNLSESVAKGLAAKPVLNEGDHLATVKRGEEWHGLILRRSEQGITVADHYSHRSHASHSSHSSHYSSRY